MGWSERLFDLLMILTKLIDTHFARSPELSNLSSMSENHLLLPSLVELFNAILFGHRV